MKKRRYIVDTSLRDGEQQPGVVFSIEQKVQIAKMLDAVGVDEIEAGTPAVGAEEVEVIKILKAQNLNAKISVWSRAQPEDVKQAIQCGPDIVHIGTPISYVQIYNKLKKNKQWVQNNLLKCVDIAHQAGMDVTIGFEDASRADVGYMIETMKLLRGQGVKQVRLADTVGVLHPSRLEEMIRLMKRNVKMNLEIHAHNDLGMATANTLAGLCAGAMYADCTVLGLGERTGNCDMRQLLQTGGELFVFGLKDDKLLELERYVERIVRPKEGVL